jgi:hypothetical protein
VLVGLPKVHYANKRPNVQRNNTALGPPRVQGGASGCTVLERKDNSFQNIRVVGEDTITPFSRDHELKSKAPGGGVEDDERVLPRNLPPMKVVK